MLWFNSDVIVVCVYLIRVNNSALLPRHLLYDTAKNLRKDTYKLTAITEPRQSYLDSLYFPLRKKRWANSKLTLLLMTFDMSSLVLLSILVELFDTYKKSMLSVGPILSFPIVYLFSPPYSFHICFLVITLVWSVFWTRKNNTLFNCEFPFLQILCQHVWVGDKPET